VPVVPPSGPLCEPGVLDPLPVVAGDPVTVPGLDASVFGPVVAIMKAKDLDEAIGIAARIPGARKGTVEVRPVIEIPGLPKESLQ
jgi:hypothetical protein